MNTTVRILEVTPDNASELGFYCVRNLKSPGYKAKLNWFNSNYRHGLRLRIAADDTGKQLGFIEYIPAEHAWRPVKAPGWLCIHCIAVLSKEARNQNIGTGLLQNCLKEAVNASKNGVCSMTGQGPFHGLPTVLFLIKTGLNVVMN
jgi:GNAT superfamily N-acetyltransferase